MPPKKVINKDPLAEVKKPKSKKEKEKDDSDISDSELSSESENEDPDDQQDANPDAYDSDYEKSADQQKQQTSEALDSDDDGEPQKESKVKNIIPRLLAAPPGGGSDDEEEPMIIEYLGAEDDTQLEDEPHKKIEKRFKIVSPDKRQTSRRLSKPECARILGDRIRHIDNGAKIYLEDYSTCKSSEEIGYLELLSKKIPMGVIRHVGQNKVEMWKLSEMLLPKLPPLEVMLTRKN
jgi:hypothetical protein